MVLRVCRRADAARRIVAALEALEGEPIAPQLYGVLETAEGHHVLAMEEIGGAEPAPADVREQLHVFVDVLRRLHTHRALAEAAAATGRKEPPGFSHRRWAEEQWQRLSRLGSADPRVEQGVAWLECVRADPVDQERLESIEVSGHGDLHLPNWRLSERGPVLLDWEDLRRFPLASEVAAFIVFAALDPDEFATELGLDPQIR